MTIWEWPADMFIDALIDKGLIPCFGRGRPCKDCGQPRVYGIRAEYCVTCNDRRISLKKHAFDQRKTDARRARNGFARDTRAKLSREQVVEIRARMHTEPKRQLAREFGVTAATIRKIARGLIHVG